MVESNQDIDEVELLKQSFVGQKFKKVRCGDVVFKKCIFSTTEFDDSSFINCTFEQCKFVGQSFYKSLIRDTKFNDCNFEMTSFFSSKLKSVDFQACVFSDVSFDQSDINKLTFTRSVVESINFLGVTKAQKIDFRGAKLNNIYGISKAKPIITSDQTLELLPQLVRDSEVVIMKDN